MLVLVVTNRNTLFSWVQFLIQYATCKPFKRCAVRFIAYFEHEDPDYVVTMRFLKCLHNIVSTKSDRWNSLNQDKIFFL